MQSADIHKYTDIPVGIFHRAIDEPKSNEWDRKRVSNILRV